MHGEILIPVTLILSACAVNLDPNPAATRVESTAEPLTGCRIAANSVAGITGRAFELTLADGSALFIAASVEREQGTTSAAFLLPSKEHGCVDELGELVAAPPIDTSVLGDGLVARPLSGLTTSEPASYLFFAAEDPARFEVTGYGVARWEPARERFVARALAWTSDRPNYGSAAVTDGGYVYVFGGLAARFLSADVYVARALLDELEVPSAYEYWAGGGNWTPQADGARPLVEGGTAPSVVYDGAHQRWLMAYATPLATEVTLRSGLGVTGPWSRPVVSGRCALPSDDAAFCGEIVLAPQWANPGGLAFTQGVSTLERVADASEYWTLLVRTPWPDLP